MTPLGRRATAGRTIVAGAVVNLGQPVVDLEVLEVGADEARRQAADPAETLRVGPVELVALGLNATDVLLNVGHEPLRRQPQ